MMIRKKKGVNEQEMKNGSKIPDKTLVGCVKKKSTLYEIFRFFRFLIKK
jgi:hypothetical protein